MATINISNSIKNATSLGEVMAIINGAADGHVEGMEGIEFTPSQLAGQYAHDAAAESDFGADKDSIDGQLEFLAEEGAKFDHYAALDHGISIAEVEA